MSLIRINKDPSRRELAVFGLLWLAFVAFAGWLAFRRGFSQVAIGLWIAAVVVPAVGAVAPALLRLVYLGLTYAALPIGLVVSYTLLAVLYYGVLTPIALVMRLCGYDPLQRRFDPQAKSYWTARDADVNVERYFRQF
jgi:hypothetical protein